MKTYYVYILINKDKNSRYKGMTLDLRKRLREHNSGKTKSTSFGRPWKVEYFESFSSVKEARAREKYFKSATGRRWIDKYLGPIVQRIE